MHIQNLALELDHHLTHFEKKTSRNSNVYVLFYSSLIFTSLPYLELFINPYPNDIYPSIAFTKHGMIHESCFDFDVIHLRNFQMVSSNFKYLLICCPLTCFFLSSCDAFSPFPQPANNYTSRLMQLQQSLLPFSLLHFHSPNFLYC